MKHTVAAAFILVNHAEGEKTQGKVCLLNENRPEKPPPILVLHQQKVLIAF